MSPTSSNVVDPVPDILPPKHPFRTLVLCFDGTGDQFDGDNSNVCQFFSMLLKNDPEKQMVYYQPGIGTYAAPYISTAIGGWVSKTLDTMFAWTLGSHVMDGYEFLMQNYRAGDRICIFGFSRGAYTARSLAGMIHKVGLLPPCNHQQVPFAYQMYTDETLTNDAKNFKACFSIDVDIEIVGVWDTVSSVGFFPYRLPFTASNSIIKTFRHAIALDEHRAKFKANLWHQDEKAEKKAVGPPARAPSSSDTDPANQGFLTVEDVEHLSGLKKIYGKGRKTPTDVEEVWFAGAHCDVGGGSVKNGTRHSLSRIPMRWMIRECFKTNSGIMFSSKGLRSIGLDPKSLYSPNGYPDQPRPSHLSLAAAASDRTNHIIRTRESDLEALSVSAVAIPLQTTEDPANGEVLNEETPNEEDEDLHDALSPAYDQLEVSPWKWWLLECIPMHSGRKKRQAEKLEVNLAQGRKVPWSHRKKGLKVHRTVHLRMQAELPEVPGWFWNRIGSTPAQQYHPKLQLDHSFWDQKVEWVG